MAKINSNETIKILSANFSNRIIDLSFLVRIDRKENKLQVTNKIQATPVNSSIMEVALNFDILREVSTTKQNPNKLEDEFNMC